MGDLTVNFVAFTEARDACQMVLVEGPWSGETTSHLHQLQDRIFDCLDAVLDGQLARKFPEAKGLDIVMRVDCYDVPRVDVEPFFRRLADGVGGLSDYSTVGSPFVRQFRFEINFDTLIDT